MIFVFEAFAMLKLKNRADNARKIFFITFISPPCFFYIYISQCRKLNCNIKIALFWSILSIDNIRFICFISIIYYIFLKVLQETIIFIQIVFIDIIMAADNAIIIGLIAANFTPRNRNKIIFWGVFAAFICRVIFALSATYLFGFPYIKILGGILLIWIVNDLRQDLFVSRKIKSPTKVSKEPSYIQSIYKVLLADITLSFDNVIGVVGAAKDYFGLLIFGLLL